MSPPLPVVVYDCVSMCTYDYLCAKYDCENMCWKGFPLCNDFCCKWKNPTACHTVIPWVTDIPVSISKRRKSPTADKCFLTGYRNDTMLLFCLKESKHASKQARVTSKRWKAFKIRCIQPSSLMQKRFTSSAYQTQAKQWQDKGNCSNIFILIHL